MLTVAYGEATLDRSNVYRWYKMFSEGREDVNNEKRAGRPSTSTTDEKINEVEKMILANCRITVREVAEDLNISIGSCHSIFINDLGMRRVAAKFVPDLLNCDQKQHCMNIADEMLDSVRDDPNLLQRVITGDEAEATLDRSNVYRWYKMFSEGREDVNDEERAGRPSTSTTDEKINKLEKMILAYRRITVREVAEDLNISIGSCHSIFINDLGMRRVAAKFVPKLLNCDQKQHRMNIANEMLNSVRDDPNLLQRVITGDEAWVYGYDVETKAQSSQWKLPHEPRPKKARQVRSNVKAMLTVFFDCRGVVHHEFLPQGRTVKREYYLQVMRNLREAIRQKRPDLWKNKNWLLHHDNAPAHTSLLVRDFLAKNNTLMMPQPPYSPDLAPCDFFLFPKLKRPMKGRRYATLHEIKTASKE
ncbi:hypothetical protein LAZ67_9001510 [Cordylochernes scorpioides]|uniref:Transposase n=1 Tax=Cordylochernes scorpioides TaxID=51811 RepID=A0ABY6KT08_9ARAC|nr:hypothetical protein LAZ67_9001510 [Cordylochernes scorpioides]